MTVEIRIKFGEKNIQENYHLYQLDLYLLNIHSSRSGKGCANPKNYKRQVVRTYVKKRSDV